MGSPKKRPLLRELLRQSADGFLPAAQPPSQFMHAEKLWSQPSSSSLASNRPHWLSASSSPTASIVASLVIKHGGRSGRSVFPAAASAYPSRPSSPRWCYCPEAWAAARAARANRLQSSRNPATGSALAGIGLTVPLSWATSRLSKGHQQSPTAVRERPVATAQWTASRLPPPPNCQLPP